MNRPPPPDRGFTLIELMIVVAVIGLLAAIAIPVFIGYQTKSKQAEAKLNLKALFTSEVVYHSENSRYVPLTTELGWSPVGICRYKYSVGGADFKGNPNPGGNPMKNDPPGADVSGFTAVAWGNIDEDPAVDTWQVTNSYVMKCVYDDVKEKSAFP